MSDKKGSSPKGKKSPKNQKKGGRKSPPNELDSDVGNEPIK